MSDVARPAPLPHSSRSVTATVLLAVDDGAYADVALRQAREAADLHGPASARATFLVHHALRLRRRSDYILRRLIDRPLQSLDPPLRAVLRGGVFELLWAEQVDVPQAVHEWVEVAKAFGHVGLGSFANGVLRNVVRQADSLREPPEEMAAAPDSEESLVQWESHPRWLVRRWLDRFGEQGAGILCRHGNREPRIHLRANPMRCTRQQLIEALTAAGIGAEPIAELPHGIALTTPGRIAALPGYDEGWFCVQDAGAQCIAPLCNVEPGQRLLDLCAAPGGKATHLAELLAGSGEVIACDKNPARLQLASESAARLQLGNLRTEPGDGRTMPGLLEPCDAVLADVPCSGTGTLARRPDLRWQLHADRLTELVPLQRELLRAAAALTRPGGLLVYATCSLEAEENDDQMAWFDAEFADFELSNDGAVTPGWDTATASATLLPDGADRDGFFAARRRRVR